MFLIEAGGKFSLPHKPILSSKKEKVVGAAPKKYSQLCLLFYINSSLDLPEQKAFFLSKAPMAKVGEKYLTQVH